MRELVETFSVAGTVVGGDMTRELFEDVSCVGVGVGMMVLFFSEGTEQPQSTTMPNRTSTRRYETVEDPPDDIR
jgi:hypothetical protein